MRVKLVLSIGAAVLLLSAFLVLDDIYDCPACEDSQSRALGSRIFCGDDGELNLIERLGWNNAWTGSRTSRKRVDHPVAGTHFVFARIAESLSPIERGKKYADPLDNVLRDRRAGEVNGGGSLLGADGKVEWIGIDLELQNLEEALILARDTLRALGAPIGSVLEFDRDGNKERLPIHE